MTILNRTNDGFVGLVLILFRAVKVLGPIPRSDLESLCAPTHPKISTENLLGKTLTRWIGLGMFALSGPDDKVSLQPPFDGLSVDDLEGLRTATLDLLMTEANCPFVSSSDDVPGNTLASDFARVAAWALSEDPLALMEVNDAFVLTRAADSGLELFKGSGRWAGFLDWAHFTGLGLPTLKGFALVPTRAIREMLSKEILGETPQPMARFIQTLADRIPILDQGRYRRQVESLQTRRPLRDTLDLSPALSLALLQLEHEGEIVIQDNPGDVALRHTLRGRAWRALRTCSHVMRGVPLWEGATRLNDLRGCEL